MGQPTTQGDTSRTGERDGQRSRTKDHDELEATVGDEEARGACTK